jgi:hypothetical protein
MCKSPYLYHQWFNKHRMVRLPRIKLSCCCSNYVTCAVSLSARSRWQKVTLRTIPNKTRTNQQIPNEPASHKTAAKSASQRASCCLAIRRVALCEIAWSTENYPICASLLMLVLMWHDSFSRFRQHYGEESAFHVNNNNYNLSYHTVMHNLLNVL